MKAFIVRNTLLSLSFTALLNHTSYGAAAPQQPGGGQGPHAPTQAGPAPAGAGHNEPEAKEREEQHDRAPGSAGAGPGPAQQAAFGIADVSGHMASFLQHSHAHRPSHKEIPAHNIPPGISQLVKKTSPEKLHVSSHEPSDAESVAMTSKANYRSVTGRDFNLQDYQARMKAREDAAIQAYEASKHPEAAPNPSRWESNYALSENKNHFQRVFGGILTANRNHIPIVLKIDASRFGQSQKINNHFDILVTELRKNPQSKLRLSKITTANNQLDDILRILTNNDAKSEGGGIAVLNALSLSCDFQDVPDLDMLNDSAKQLTLYHQPETMPLSILQTFHHEIVLRGSLTNLSLFSVSDQIDDWINQQYKKSGITQKSVSANENVSTYLQLLSQINLQILEQDHRRKRNPHYTPGRFLNFGNTKVMLDPTPEEMTQLTSQKQPNLKMLWIAYTPFGEKEDYQKRHTIQDILLNGLQSGNLPSLISYRCSNYNQGYKYEITKAIYNIISAQEDNYFTNLPIEEEERKEVASDGGGGGNVVRGSSSSSSSSASSSSSSSSSSASAPPMPASVAGAAVPPSHPPLPSTAGPTAHVTPPPGSPRSTAVHAPSHSGSGGAAGAEAAGAALGPIEEDPNWKDEVD